MEVEKKLQKLRERNEYLETLLGMYKQENEVLLKKLHFQEGFIEKLDDGNERLLSAIKVVLDAEPSGEEEDWEMLLNSLKSHLNGVLNGDF